MEQAYEKLDALTCKITTTTTQSNNANVAGVLSKKKEIEAALVAIDETIVEMKKVGIVFEDAVAEPPAETPE